ncbi:hypothetical protein AALP_AAs45425U000100 [Arabis alpina]|uniref:Uncharacterized protein n=1 Tax=Arabis alpina TaxID=50452 RepID=A0A087G0I5_ARAAL|nr:hypothetical protein AALP_AAs45425U000100 [Arabis alpina]
MRGFASSASRAAAASAKPFKPLISSDSRKPITLPSILPLGLQHRPGLR